MEEKKVLLDDIKQAIITSFVIKTIGIRKRRFDRSTSSKVKIKINISTNYIVEQRGDKYEKHENVKSGVLKTIRTYKSKIKKTI